ncbi:uncharacterized protein BJX67DRAFT_294212 [Aspergillus lucknowensis]|uniref:Uncharacterized protein n=1 Tax=Aspergillus lucknowensis TaxID=176173 RepID=A0ABR4LDN7_9EURO
MMQRDKLLYQTVGSQKHGSSCTVRSSRRINGPKGGAGQGSASIACALVAESLAIVGDGCRCRSEVLRKLGEGICAVAGRDEHLDFFFELPEIIARQEEGGAPEVRVPASCVF